LKQQGSKKESIDQKKALLPTNADNNALFRNDFHQLKLMKVYNVD